MRLAILQTLLKLEHLLFTCHQTQHQFFNQKSGVIVTFKTYYLCQTFVEMVRVLDRSDKIINFLKGINNINRAWEGMSVSCVSGVWHKLLQEFMHDFTGFEPVENTAEDISSLVEEARLDKVTPEEGTELLHSHGQQLSKEDLEEMDRELSQHKERE